MNTLDIIELQREHYINPRETEVVEGTPYYRRWVNIANTTAKELCAQLAESHINREDMFWFNEVTEPLSHFRRGQYKNEDAILILDGYDNLQPDEDGFGIFDFAKTFIKEGYTVILLDPHNRLSDSDWYR